MLFGHHNNDVTQPEPDVAAPVQTPPSVNPLAVDPESGVSLPVVESQVPQGTPEIAPEALADAASSFGGLQLPPPPSPITPAVPATAPVADTVAPATDVTPAEDVAPAAPPIVTMPEPTTIQPAAALDEAPETSALEPMATPEATTPLADLAPAPVESLDAPTLESAPESAPTLEQPTVAPESSNQQPVMPYDEPSPTNAATEQPAAVVAQQPAFTPGATDLLSLKQQALTQLTPLVDKLDQTPEERFRTKMMMIQSTDDQSLIQDAYNAAQAIADEKNRAQALLDIINEINYFTSQSS